MVELGVLKLAVKSLGSSQDKEKETAVLLLHELSLHLHTCKQMGSEKGAILFLVGLTTNIDEDLQIARVAEKTLKNLEQMDVTVLQMAEAGRLQPLLSRLCEGTNKQEILQMSLPCVFSLSFCLSLLFPSCCQLVVLFRACVMDSAGSEETQMKMAQHLAQMTLTNNSKGMVARSGSEVLVKMLLRNAEAKEASLGAILNLSLLDDTAPLLINAGVLCQLLAIMFSADEEDKVSTRLKETAASTLANLLSTPRNWERVRVDEDGHTLKSESILQNFLGLLTDAHITWKDKIIRSLYYIALSPQASGQFLSISFGIVIIASSFKLDFGLLFL